MQLLGIFINKGDNKVISNIKKVKTKEKIVNKKMSIVMVGDVLTHDAVLADALNSDGSYDFS